MKQFSKPLILGASIDSAGIGGVTIHLQRLQQWLDKDNFQYDFCDYKKTSISKQLYQIAKHKVVHIHISRPFPRVIYTLFCKIVGTRSIITIHGNIGRFSTSGNICDQLSVRISTIPILINHQSFEKAVKWNKHSTMLSAFIPPIDKGTLPNYVSEIISKAKKDGYEIIASNASVMSFTEKGDETYGISFLIDYFKNHPKYFLCVSDPSGQYAEKYHRDNFNNVLFITEKHSFYRLIELSDVVLRPTATDGDALSVKEGLYLKKKVITTDIVDRPDGVVLFHYNDSESLTKALASDSPINSNQSIDDENVVSSLISIYNSLSNK